jgi:hypothetical protein
MLEKTAFAGLVALCLLAAPALAQTMPGDQPAAPAAGPTTPSAATPAGRTQDDMSRMHAPPAAAQAPAATQNGSDAATTTRGSSEDKAIAKCKMMPSDQAMKDAACSKLMKKHPSMMNEPQ